MRILLFDIFITGHHSEYINHLVDYIVEKDTTNEFFFVVHPIFLNEFPYIKEKSVTNKNINWVEVSQKEFDSSCNGNILKKSLRLYRIMNKYALLYKVEHAILLSLNSFQFSLSIFRSSYGISGILFKQFSRTSKSRNPIMYYRKYLQTFLVTINKKIKEIFILNDDVTVNYLNLQFRTSIFKVLPDPIPEILPLKGFDMYKQYNIDKGKAVFLHIGSLGERKGTFDILKSVELLPIEVRNKIFVLLVGKVNSEIENRINKMIEELNISSVCFFENDFVSNEKMKSLFLQCSSVLVPYKNPESSSGIIGHAAASKKPVISPSLGLLGELVKTYDLGFTIKENSPKCISQAIIGVLDTPFTKTSRQMEFVKSHSPCSFSKIILGI
ncbi:Glycosyltransferase involved in cell wall bisynthesis [Cyclobacterium lianum]|uniref:Glycosyltransferase involved in cell wall bisynthesis n=1 Tax=Cyclobacterium lianum TaxID=388280 RepID=A0A1M7NSC0_9BACT|nr:glycosyltransferase [Cyclobacterium lianum]SHN06905.1 Glycosyltransferase involved in cell wall bisynthesis [Cyclobacterium lianum]